MGRVPPAPALMHAVAAASLEYIIPSKYIKLSGLYFMATIWS